MSSETSHSLNPEESAQYTPAEQELLRDSAEVDAVNVPLNPERPAEQQPRQKTEQYGADGELLMRTETWADTQATQFEFRPDGVRVEHGKILAAADTEQVGKEVARVFPNEPVVFAPSRFGQAGFSGTVESYGWTAKQSAGAATHIAEVNKLVTGRVRELESIGQVEESLAVAETLRDPREPWLKIISQDEGLAGAIEAQFASQIDQAVANGKNFARIDGEFGSVTGLAVAGQTIDISRIRRLDVNIDPATKKVTKVSLGAVVWAPAAI